MICEYDRNIMLMFADSCDNDQHFIDKEGLEYVKLPIKEAHAVAQMLRDVITKDILDYTQEFDKFLRQHDTSIKQIVDGESVG